MVLFELLVSFTGELAWLGRGWGLTSIGHHYFLDWSILARRVGEAGEKTRPPHSRQAEAASGRNVPQHPRRKRKKTFNVHKVSRPKPTIHTFLQYLFSNNLPSSISQVKKIL